MPYPATKDETGSIILSTRKVTCRKNTRFFHIPSAYIRQVGEFSKVRVRIEGNELILSPA